ncbi:hypothetical protein KKG52_00860 [Patescibacteria group bacterium]|nr:hypothetical protein [Patescibacteria group bacterium]
MKTAAQKIKASTQKFTEIEDIREDIVILSGQSAVTIIEIIPTNFSLLSQQEQDAKLFSYSSFLNSLSFPIQIIIRNKKLDISLYLKSLEEQAKNSQNEMLSQHILLYKNFVSELIKVNSVLDKKFYICISYSYMEKGVGATTSVAKRSNKKEVFFEEAKAALHSKAQAVYSQIGRVGLKPRTLEQEELVRLFYEIYNDQTVEITQVAENIQTPVIKKQT